VIASCFRQIAKFAKLAAIELRNIHSLDQRAAPQRSQRSVSQIYGTRGRLNWSLKVSFPANEKRGTEALGAVADPYRATRVKAPEQEGRRWEMSTVSLDLQRRCEKRWASRFERTVEPEPAAAPEHQSEKQDRQPAASRKGKGKGKARRLTLEGSRSEPAGGFEVGTRGVSAGPKPRA
jgi:hypothetical protein